MVRPPYPPPTADGPQPELPIHAVAIFPYNPHPLSMRWNRPGRVGSWIMIVRRRFKLHGSLEILNDLRFSPFLDPP